MSNETQTRAYEWGEVGEDGVRHFDCHTQQGLSILSETPITLCCAGTGGGKSCTLGLFLLKQIDEYVEAGKPKNGFLAFLIAPTHKILMRASCPVVIDTLDSSQYRGVFKESKAQYIIPNVGVLWVLSSDNALGLVGGQADCVLLDECGQMPAKIIEECIQRVMIKKGRIYGVSTPYRKNWFSDYIERSKNGDPDISAFVWSSIDNPAYPIESFELARRTLPPDLFAMRFMARFTSTEGLCYYNFSEDNIKPVRYDASKPLIVSSDFNVDPMSWVIMQRDGNTVNVIDELYMRHTNTETSLRQLTERYKNHRSGWHMYGDASSRQRHTSAAKSDHQQIVNCKALLEMGRTIHYRKSNPAVADRMAAVCGKLKSASGRVSLYIDPSVQNLLSDIQSLYYREGTRVPDTRSGGHLCDALGYYISQEFPVTIKKSESLGRVSIRRNKTLRRQVG